MDPDRGLADEALSVPILFRRNVFRLFLALLLFFTLKLLDDMTGMDSDMKILGSTPAVESPRVSATIESITGSFESVKASN
jgi:hypothetical protein